MEREEKEKEKEGHAITVARKGIFQQSAGRLEGERPKEVKEELRDSGLKDSGVKATTRPNQAQAQADTVEVKDTGLKEEVKAAEAGRASGAGNMGI